MAYLATPTARRSWIITQTSTIRTTVHIRQTETTTQINAIRTTGNTITAVTAEKGIEGGGMAGWIKRAPAINTEAEKARLMELSEKELLVEMILELKRISEKCDEIGRKIVIWSN